MTLPFVVAPRPSIKRRIGDESSGILEMEVRGGLSVGEGDLIAELLESEGNTVVLKAKAADAIAVAEGISLLEAKALIDKVLDNEVLEPDAEEVLSRHEETLAQLTVHFRRFIKKYRAAVVTALVRYRLNQPQWSVEETATLAPVLFNGIYDLAQEEQDTENNGLPAAALTEEDLGKQPEGSGKKPGRTGRRSSGDSATPTPDSLIEAPLLESCVA